MRSARDRQLYLENRHMPWKFTTATRPLILLLAIRSYFLYFYGIRGVWIHGIIVDHATSNEERDLERTFHENSSVPLPIFPIGYTYYSTVL